ERLPRLEPVVAHRVPERIHLWAGLKRENVKREVVRSHLLTSSRFQSSLPVSLCQASGLCLAADFPTAACTFPTAFWILPLTCCPVSPLMAPTTSLTFPLTCLAFPATSSSRPMCVS